MDGAQGATGETGPPGGPSSAGAVQQAELASATLDNSFTALLSLPHASMPVGRHLLLGKLALVNTSAARRLVTCQLTEKGDKRDTASVVLVEKGPDLDGQASLALTVVEDVKAEMDRDLELACKYTPRIGDGEQGQVKAENVRLIAVQLKDL